LLTIPQQLVEIAIPVNLTSCVPFRLSGQPGPSFSQACSLGGIALPIGFSVHRAIARALIG